MISKICALGLLLIIGVSAVNIQSIEDVFNRDPVRIPDGGGMLAPADGVVTSVSNNLVYTYIGLQDVHIQRTPVDGRVSDVLKYHEECKDKVKITIITDDGKIEVTQISGYVARTVETFVVKGDVLYRGQKIGRILLGSATTTTVPQNYDIIVNVGDYVKAGETVIAVKI